MFANLTFLRIFDNEVCVDGSLLEAKVHKMKGK
jgi:hypothetical protein